MDNCRESELQPARVRTNSVTNRISRIISDSADLRAAGLPIPHCRRLVCEGRAASQRQLGFLARAGRSIASYCRARSTSLAESSSLTSEQRFTGNSNCTPYNPTAIRFRVARHAQGSNAVLKFAFPCAVAEPHSVGNHEIIFPDRQWRRCSCELQELLLSAIYRCTTQVLGY